jgi:hypothetical protein
MIDRRAFTRSWQEILTRFGRDPEPGQAAAYYEYLSEQMDTEQFLAAARALWATARYFPRPADFLLMGAGGEWDTVRLAMEGVSTQSWAGHWRTLSARSQDACRALGGVPHMADMWARDSIRLKAAWEAEYERTVAVAALSLPPARTPQLTDAT